MSTLKANRIENLTTTNGGIDINNSGNVGVGAASPGANLEVRGSSSNGQIRIGGSTSGTYSQIYSDNDGVLILNADQGNNAASSYLGLNVDNSERLRIDSSGRLLVGTSSDTTGDTGAKVQIVDTGTPVLALSRNDTSITSGNTIGQIRIFSNDDSGYQECARIAAQADGTFANNDKPTRLVFSTTADGASSPTERMRIDSSGNVGIGLTSPDGKLTLPAAASNTPALRLQSASSSTDVALSSYADASGTYAALGANYYLNSGGNGAVFDTNDKSAAILLDGRNSGSLQFLTGNTGVATERARIDSSGRLLVGTTSTLQANDKISVDGQVGIGGQRYGFLSKNVNVGNSVTFDIVGDVNNLVFVRVRITVGYTGNSNYQMHAQYDYLTCNFSTTGGSATITNIAQIESGNAQFNTSDWSVSRPANRTVRLTYSPSSGSGTHHPTVYVDGLFSTIS